MNVKKTIEKHYRFDCSTDNMLQELLERKESKVSESEYVRELIRRDYSASIGIDPSDLVVIKRQLIGIGRNINQIAHCFNAGQYGVVDLSRLDPFLLFSQASGFPCFAVYSSGSHLLTHKESADRLHL